MTQFGVQPRMAGSPFFPKPQAPPPPTVGQGAWVIAQVCRERRLAPAQLTGQSRSPDFVDARMRVAVILKRDRGWSLPRIGRLLNRDHTTILHLLRKAEAMGIYDDIRLAEPASARAPDDRLASLSDAYRVASECYQIACRYGVTGDAEAALWEVVKREGGAAMAKRKV